MTIEAHRKDNLELTDSELDCVTGGMNLDGYRESTNVEDRRGDKGVAVGIMAAIRYVLSF